MAHFLDGVISELIDSRVVLMNYFGYLQTQFNSAAYYLDAHDTANAAIHFQNIATDFYMITGALALSSDSFSAQTRLGFVKIRQYWGPEPFDFNMDAILNAMLAADPAQVMYFVGLVDAYRQSIWNRPFNQEMYAALARGFMEWE